jgi:hypothetical protein
MSHLFLVAYIGVMASSATLAVALGTVVTRVETKMAPMTTTMSTTNEMRHGAPSTPLSDPLPKEGKGKGEEGEGGGHHCGRQW